jgi:predicted DNA-binding transcriptional regulator YafY
MVNDKKDRMLEIFFRAMRGGDLSVKDLADEYEVSSKSISRDINDIKAFLAEHRELVGHTELEYCHADKVYRLSLEEFLSEKELFSLVKVVLGARAYSKMEVLTLIEKLKRFVTPAERTKLGELIRCEMFHYNEVKHDCESLQDNLWKLIGIIRARKEITIQYYKIDRCWVERRICPVSLMFSEYYFYLIAFKAEDETQTPVYFRVDRITGITEHRRQFEIKNAAGFNEGELRERCQFMFPGKLRTIRFEFTGPSVQAILDRLPTAKIIERKGGKYLIEAEVYGDGIKMYLLSQGSWVKVISPEEFVEEVRSEIDAMKNKYGS